MSGKIEIVYLSDQDQSDTGYEIWMEFLDWLLCIVIDENTPDISHSIWEGITIYNKGGMKEVTNDFMMFRDDDTVGIQPTGSNLFQVMDVLRTNYKRARKEE